MYKEGELLETQEAQKKTPEINHSGENVLKAEESKI